MLHKVLFNQNPLDHQPQFSNSVSTSLRNSVVMLSTSAFLSISLLLLVQVRRTVIGTSYRFMPGSAPTPDIKIYNMNWKTDTLWVKIEQIAVEAFTEKILHTALVWKYYQFCIIVKWLVHAYFSLTVKWVNIYTCAHHRPFHCCWQ